MKEEQQELANKVDITAPQIEQNLDEIEEGIQEVHDAVAGTDEQPGIAETFDNEFNDSLGVLQNFREKMDPIVEGIIGEIGDINNKVTDLITTYSKLSGVTITPPDFSSTISALNSVKAAADAAANAVSNAGGSTPKPTGKNTSKNAGDNKDTGSSSSGGGGCFDAGTKITMANGLIKNIENIQIGDTVMAYNDENQKFEPRIVTKAYIHHNTPAVIDVHFADGTVLGMTPGHPLLSTDG